MTVRGFVRAQRTRSWSSLETDAITMGYMASRDSLESRGRAFLSMKETSKCRHFMLECAQTRADGRGHRIIVHGPTVSAAYAAARQGNDRGQRGVA